MSFCFDCPSHTLLSIVLPSPIATSEMVSVFKCVLHLFMVTRSVSVKLADRKCVMRNESHSLECPVVMSCSMLMLCSTQNVRMLLTTVLGMSVSTPGSAVDMNPGPKPTSGNDDSNEALCGSVVMSGLS